MAKKITNLKPYKYEVFVEGTKFWIDPLATAVFEDRVAEEFKKYFPTVLVFSDYVEEKKVEAPVVEEPKIEEPIIEELKVEEEIKEVSEEKPKRKGRPRKSK